MSAAGPGLRESHLRTLLADVAFVRRVVVLPRCGSTNDEVRRLAAEGACEGTVVVADRQDAGRGRLGRRWESRAGEGLYLSVLLHPRDGVERVTRWTLAAAVAGCDACRKVCGTPVTIKWPNDLQAGGRKLGGILAELRVHAGRADLVVGLGVNVLQEAAAFSPDLAGRATSLLLATPAGDSRRGTLSVEALAQAYLDELGRVAERLHRGEWAAVAAAWLARAPGALGATVRVEAADGAWTGITRGIDEAGALLVERPGGGISPIRAVESVIELESRRR